MSSSNDTTVQTRGKTYHIPSLLTTSLRAVFDAFGDAIIELRAHGGPTTDNTERIDSLKRFGVSYRRRDHQEVKIDYQRRGSKHDPINPLTRDAREEILAEIEAKLGGHGSPTTPDIPVKKLRIRIEDERLQEAVPTAREPEFDLTFKSEPAEEAVRDRTRRKNAERNLYEGQGWNIRNLNLHLVEETAAKYDGQTDPTCMSWHGREDIRPRIDGGRVDGQSALVVRVYNHVLPDEYAHLKPYTVMDNEVLDIPRGAADSETEEEQTNGDTNE